MYIKIWGCRGSVPTPGEGTLRYGGNTTCLEIRTKTGCLLVIDAGSGIRLLGKKLLQREDDRSFCLLLTHAHWDHLVGFPFFSPAYDSRYTIRVCGGTAARDSLRHALSQHMEAPYFPMAFEMMEADFRFECQNMGESCCHGDELEAIPLNHPNGGRGFKLTEDGKSFVFLTDNELGFAHEGGLGRDGYIEACRGADLLLHDAQYTDEEYQRTKGWGHSTITDAVDLALEANVRRLGLFHHDPDRTDDDIEAQVQFCKDRIRVAGIDLEVFAVAEEMIITV